MACTEDKEITPFTYTQVFSGKTQKTWAIDEVLVKKNGESFSEIELSTCEKDDRYIFKADPEKSYLITNGASSCDENEEDTYVENNWSFINSGAVLTIAIPRIFGFFLIPFIVKEATKDKMVLEIYANQENTISYQITMKAIAEQ